MKRRSSKRRLKGHVRKLSSPLTTKNRHPLVEKKPQTFQETPISPHSLVRLGNVMSRLRSHDSLILLEKEARINKPDHQTAK
jgi:hypothetical protein